MRVGHWTAVTLWAAAAVTFSVGVQAADNLASDATRLPDLMIDSIQLRLSQSEFEIETGRNYRWRSMTRGQSTAGWFPSVPAGTVSGFPATKTAASPARLW